MAVTLTMTWVGGVVSQTSCGFTLTDDLGNEQTHNYGKSLIGNIFNPVHRAVAEELSNQAGSATGTVTVVIA